MTLPAVTRQSSRPLRRGDVVAHALSGEVLLYDPRAERTHRLNPAATLLWERCDGRTTVADLARLLTERFSVDLDVAMRDVHSAVRHLALEQLIECPSDDEGTSRG